MFKIGDRVKVKIAEGVEQCGKIIDIVGDWYAVFLQNGSIYQANYKKLTLITDPMDCLMVGDILFHINGNCRIMGIVGELYAISLFDEFTTWDGLFYSVRKLKNSGYTLFQPTSTKIQEAIDLLEREGKIVDGKIIK